jgi:hypothetical protein
MVTVSAHAYPWDVIGDPEFTDRVRSLGLAGVTLAASYHSARAATPLHPRHQIVDARWATLYRPVREAAWGQRRLRPTPPTWTEGPDPFGAAAAALRAAGIAVTAWIVLTHSTRLGSANPDVAVLNCFGETYPYALCPANPEVRDYAATLGAEAVRGVAVDGVSLEACGQLGLAHLGHHEKTDGAWTPHAARLLSVCCCLACRAGWTGRGLDPEEVVRALRAAVRAEAVGRPAPLGAEMDGALLATRQVSTDALRAHVLEAVRREAPGAHVTLHAHPDPWVTGPSPGLTPTASSDVDALLVPAWPTASATADLIAAAARTGCPVDAYVTVLAPADPGQLAAHVRRLVTAGATRLSLYHLGLVPMRQRFLFNHVLAAVAEQEGARS